jgi:hypothetical protein
MNKSIFGKVLPEIKYFSYESTEIVVTTEKC